MKNINSTNGITEDLLRACSEIGCTEQHIRSLIIKYESQLENGIIDTANDEITSSHLDKIARLDKQLENLAEVRRDIMRKLIKMHPNGNQDLWCNIKHLNNASNFIFEAYQGSDRDTELYSLLLDIERERTLTISEFLGTEIKPCASCLDDMLKDKER